MNDELKVVRHCPACGQTVPDYSQPLIHQEWVVFYPNGVSYQGKDIRLTNGEFGVFEKVFRNYVVHHRDTSIQELIQHLYPDGQAERDTIGVFIHRIRRKLPGKFIQSIRGWGWRFHPESTEDADPRRRSPFAVGNDPRYDNISQRNFKGVLDVV